MCIVFGKIYYLLAVDGNQVQRGGVITRFVIINKGLRVDQKNRGTVIRPTAPRANACLAALYF